MSRPGKGMVLRPSESLFLSMKLSLLTVGQLKEDKGMKMALPIAGEYSKRVRREKGTYPIRVSLIGYEVGAVGTAQPVRALLITGGG